MAEPTSPPCVATSAETGVSGDAWLLRAIAAPFYKPYCSEQHETITAYSPRPSPKRDWLIATEEGVHNVRVCRYEYQEDALAAFDKIWCSRVLYNPNDEEVKCAGVNRLAINTIRRVMKSNYFADK
ncbi:TPA: hypothetical protein N0F65_012413 [Lagenidium giganteum]|uniref:Uncharacterized protein n=1 Tax=Lagenidium giganteum TaxID=4803 RepID=A0AAV2YI50_9STRA|nr:TPA: hypothetical protein N0F65_012413 [Lagenidium giganteum]